MASTKHVTVTDRLQVQKYDHPQGLDGRPDRSRVRVEAHGVTGRDTLKLEVTLDTDTFQRLTSNGHRPFTIQLTTNAAGIGIEK